MAKYKSRPSIIEAFQWRHPREYDGNEPSGYLPKGVYATYAHSPDANRSWRFYVITIHGEKAFLVDEDWVVTEPDGKHHYPIKPDIFKVKYERVAE